MFQSFEIPFSYLRYEGCSNKLSRCFGCSLFLLLSDKFPYTQQLKTISFFLLLLQFFRSEIQGNRAGLFAQSLKLKAEIKVLTSCDLIWNQGHLSSSLLPLLEEFSFLQLQDRNPCSFANCWLQPPVTSQKSLLDSCPIGHLHLSNGGPPLSHFISLTSSFASS